MRGGIPEGVIPALVVGAVAAVVFVLDLVTKRWVSIHMTPGQSIPVIPGLFSITYLRNSGAAFGLLQGQTLLFIVITLVVIGLIVTYGRRAARSVPLLGVAFGLQLGGALGNLMDRILYARVIDFLQVRGFPFIFNVADMGITIGGALFAIFVLRETAPQEPGPR